MPKIQMTRNYSDGGKHLPQSLHVVIPDNDSINEITIEFVIPDEHDSFVQIRRNPEAGGRNKDGWEVFTDYKVKREA